MNIPSIHTDAMDLAEKADIAHARGNADDARRYLTQAWKKERQAAELALKENAPEPTRTILLKSAAHLAIQCGQLRPAEQLINMALAGEPTEELADELRSMFEEVNFDRHLNLRGVQLQDNDMQLVLVGNAIAPGLASSEEFIGRLAVVQKLIYRTSESDRKLPYREQGGPPQAVGNVLQLFVSLPRAASFAVSLRVASEKDQSELYFAESSEVLSRLFERLTMFEQNDLVALQQAVPVAEYYENFLRLASDLAPDGDNVRLVGLTSSYKGVERRLEMKRPAKADAKGLAFVAPSEIRRMEGRVFFFNNKDEENPIIKLVATDGTEWRLKADQDKLQKAVLYAARKTRVTVSGVQVGKTSLQVAEFTPLRDRPPQKPPSKRKRLRATGAGTPTTAHLGTVLEALKGKAGLTLDLIAAATNLDPKIVSAALRQLSRKKMTRRSNQGRATVWTLEAA